MKYFLFLFGFQQDGCLQFSLFRAIKPKKVYFIEQELKLKKPCFLSFALKNQNKTSAFRTSRLFFIKKFSILL